MSTGGLYIYAEASALEEMRMGKVGDAEGVVDGRRFEAEHFQVCEGVMESVKLSNSTRAS